MKHVTYPDAKTVRSSLNYQNGQLYWKCPLGRRNINKPIGSLARNGYLIVNWQTPQGRKKLLVHRLVWLMFNDTLPPILDHINRNKQDNKIENLRPLTAAENARNCGDKHWKHDLPRGITIQRGKYKAQIKVNKKTKNIGLYDTLEAAVGAYTAFLVTLEVDSSSARCATAHE